jgi:hypothetical protein
MPSVYRLQRCTTGKVAKAICATTAIAPCGGAGIVNELPDGSVNKIRVQKAIRLAAVGVTFHDFDPAHFTALAVRAVLAEGAG